MPDLAETRRFFDAIASRYDRVFARPKEDLRARMKRVLEILGPPGDVLDLGVGTGAELPILLDAGHRVVGVDASEKMIALCTQRARPIRCVNADFWGELPFERGSFDAIIALFGTLAHAPSPKAYAHLAREARRVLRRGGHFYAELPSPEWTRAHPVFEDPTSHARIEIVSPSEEEWLAAFADLDPTIAREGDELFIIASAP